MRRFLVHWHAISSHNIGKAYITGVEDFGTCMYRGISRALSYDVRVLQTPSQRAWRFLRLSYASQLWRGVIRCRRAYALACKEVDIVRSTCMCSPNGGLCNGQGCHASKYRCTAFAFLRARRRCHTRGGLTGREPCIQML